MANRIDHEAMKRASEIPVEGPAATDNVAASGGLDVPGREPHRHTPIDAPSPLAEREPIPGEHDHTTLAPTEPGIVGTTGFGADLPATDDSTVDHETARRNRWEGGGRTTPAPTAVPRPGPDTEAHPGERKPESDGNAD